MGMTVTARRRLLLDMARRRAHPGTGSARIFLEDRTAVTPWRTWKASSPWAAWRWRPNKVFIFENCIGGKMTGALRMEVSPQETIRAVKRMRKLEREAFLEDLLASTSPEYLESIKEARGNTRPGKSRPMKRSFGGRSCDQGVSSVPLLWRGGGRATSDRGLSLGGKRS